VSHEYIKKTLQAFGLENFIPIFELLYKDQKVDIALNGDVIDGYVIKNGVKQGDSLSCILFIMCIDPLIRNIESNNEIERVDIGDCVSPKILAYADDVTCFVDSKRSLKYVFKEYERLSKASGLVLNADKTEILDRTSRQYSFNYMNEQYRVKGLEEAKINGIIFHRDENRMKDKNYEMLQNKIVKSLAGWKARRLSLLGKILIYKTFGLSQIIYVLSVLELEAAQYKRLEQMFNNFIWGRELHDASNYNRISQSKMNTTVINGGFGMINFKDIINGIRCRQLGKMFSEEYNHPLKYCVIKAGKSFASRTCLTGLIDTVGKQAHELLLGSILKNHKSVANEDIVSDNILIQQLGETETVFTIKINKRLGAEMMSLIYEWGCTNFKEIVLRGRQYRRIMAICKKIMIAKYLRILKLLVQSRNDLHDGIANKIKLVTNKYKEINAVSSKEFRLMLKGAETLNITKLGEGLNNLTIKDYFNQVRRLPNTRHKNTLLRVWNGDCLSNSRLFRFGIVDNNTCPRCDEYDSPEHMLFTCVIARRVWELLMQKIPKPLEMSVLHYAIGINDSRVNLMVKAEVLKYIMHYRELNSDVMIQKSLAYLKLVHNRNAALAAL